MLSVYTINRHSLINRIIKILFDQIVSFTFQNRYGKNSLVKRIYPNSLWLKIEDDISCFVYLDFISKKKMFKLYSIEMEIKVKILNEEFLSIINLDLIDFKKAFKYCKFKLNKDAFEEILFEEFSSTHEQIEHFILTQVEKYKLKLENAEKNDIEVEEV